MRRLGFLLLLGVHAGCAVRQAPSPVDLGSQTFSESGAAAVPDEWWRVFDDPALDAVMDEALRNNFTVRSAFARLRAAEEGARQARAPLAPEVSAYADAFTGTDSDDGGVNRPPVELGVQASYELDLWGRFRAELRSDVAARQASRADAQAAAVSLTAAVARTWIAMGATQEQLELLDEQLEANQGMAAVVEARFLNGVVRQADSLRQQRLLEQTRAEKVLRLADMEVLEHQLAVLVGRTPLHGAGASPTQLPDLPPIPDAGVPAELMRRRPDVQAAEYRMTGADADLSAAIAAQFPQLSLRGAVSNTPVDPASILEGWVSSIGANLLAPLFAMGERRAEVRRRQALLDAQVSDYGGVLLTALQEVEDALSRNRRQTEFLVILDRQVDLAARTAVGLQAQYTGGLDVGYLDVLTAQTAAQQLRRQRIVAQQESLELRVDLYRALAGGITPPQDSNP